MKSAFRILPYLYIAFALIAIFYRSQFISHIYFSTHHTGLDLFDFHLIQYSPVTIAFYTAIISILIIALVCGTNAVFILKRKYRIVSLFLSGLLCLMIPFGTILGIVSIVILTRSEITSQYAEQGAAANP
jgi:hypothetical protein